MADKKESYKNYKIAIELVRHEGQLLWLIFGGFSVIDSALLLFAIDRHYAFSIAGLVLTVIWLFSYIRSYNMYVFRIMQAREVEPNECTLLKKGGEFSKGEKVTVGEEKPRQQPLRGLKTGRLIYAIFVVFIVLYLLLIFAKVFNCNFLQL
jgi:quinol-cytochrome oxidoreductase complex cytochrome b subunit